MSDEVSFKEFKKLKIRIGTVKELERVSGSDKLYIMQVDLGEELKGLKIAVLNNLKTAKIFVHWYYGMLLASEKDGELALLTTDREIANGAKIT